MVSLVFRLADSTEVRIEAEEGVSVMEAAVANNVPGITADCGGSMICGTCHVRVAPAAQRSLPHQSDAELDLLEYVPDPQPDTRLTCQIPISSALEGMEFLVPVSQH